MSMTMADIAAMTISETGWTRLNAQTMRYVGEPIPVAGGRHAVQLQGRARGLAITTAYLPDDVDLGDAEAVADELEDGWPAMLPLPALIVLRSALDMAIEAMEAAQQPKGADALTPERSRAA